VATCWTGRAVSQPWPRACASIAPLCLVEPQGKVWGGYAGPSLRLAQLDERAMSSRYAKRRGSGMAQATIGMPAAPENPGLFAESGTGNAGNGPRAAGESPGSGGVRLLPSQPADSLSTGWATRGPDAIGGEHVQTIVRCVGPVAQVERHAGEEAVTQMGSQLA